MFKAFDAAPTGINFTEVYSALQTQDVEGQENPLSIIYFAKLYEVQKYLSETNHMWDGFWFLANGKLWNGLPAGRPRCHREEPQQVGGRSARRHPQAERDVPGRTDDKKGMEFIKADQKPFRAKLQAAGFYKEWKGKYGEEAGLCWRNTPAPFRND